jgi:hypothetical protein
LYPVSAGNWAAGRITSVLSLFSNVILKLTGPPLVWLNVTEPAIEVVLIFAEKFILRVGSDETKRKGCWVLPLIEAEITLKGPAGAGVGLSFPFFLQENNTTTRQKRR